MRNILLLIILLTLLFVLFTTWSCLVIASRCEDQIENIMYKKEYKKDL